jgi:uncharacterized protein YcbK (DUF882 family)
MSSAGRTTVLLLVPGRSTVTLELNARWPFALLALLALPLLTGTAAQRCLDPAHGGRSAMLALSEMTGSMQALGREPAIGRMLDVAAASERETARAFVSVAHAEARDVPERIPTPSRASALARDMVSAQQVLRVFAPHVATAPAAADPANTWLRVQALHLDESVRVRPFDASGAVNPEAFDAIRHLMRCRITGDEIAIDPRLVRILVQIGATYDKTIQLVSGHRMAHTIGTHTTSQHTLGKAADIRVPGVGIEQLRALALKLGARGVGLYPEKGFVHIDVRDKAKYTWKWTEAQGEEPDMR